MQILSLVWGILAILGLGVGIIPCLGSLNWINIPFAAIGLVIGIVAKSKPGNSGAATIGIVLNAMAVAFGIFRLILGGGIL
jgi:hypothetical protein